MPPCIFCPFACSFLPFYISFRFLSNKKEKLFPNILFSKFVFIFLYFPDLMVVTMPPDHKTATINAREKKAPKTKELREKKKLRVVFPTNQTARFSHRAKLFQYSAPSCDAAALSIMCSGRIIETEYCLCCNSARAELYARYYQAKSIAPHWHGLIAHCNENLMIKQS